MATGKTIRMRRVFNGKDTALIFAPVHNSTSVEPFPGQVDVPAAINQAVTGGATAIVISKGSLRRSAPQWQSHVGILHYIFTYAALGPNPTHQVQVGTVEESLALGADGVCVFVGLNTMDDATVLAQLGQIGAECDRHGLVFVCEAEFPNFYAPISESLQTYGLRYLKYASRVCSELGADVVSTNWPGNEEQFGELVEYAQVPILLNGGPQMAEDDFLAVLEASARAGGRGCLVGRNFSERPSIEQAVRAAAQAMGGDKTSRALQPDWDASAEGRTAAGQLTD